MLVLLRCDGGGRLGVGHVIRCLALAEAAVAAGHQVVVAGHFEGSFLSGQIGSAPVEVIALEDPANGGDSGDVGDSGDSGALADLIGRLRPDVLHVDSYRVSVPGREVLGDLVLSSMEDGVFGRRPADVVIDPTLGAELWPRPDDGSTWVLRGSRYIPVRRRVVDARRPGTAALAGEGAGTEVIPVRDAPARSVLVVMGGTDPVGLTPAVVEVLARTGLALEVTAIADGENADRTHAAARGSSLSLTILAPVDDLAAMMAGQDLVISAAGTSVWELCCIGVPMAVVRAVENQRQGYDRVVAAGVAVGLGGPGLAAGERAVGLLRAVLTDSAERATLALAGRQVVDGLGGWRVVRTWEQASSLGRSAQPESPHQLTARRANLSDARLLWQWRNDPATRAGSRSSAEVAWEDHRRWLGASLTRADRVLLVIEEPEATIRPGDPDGTDGPSGPDIPDSPDSPDTPESPGGTDDVAVPVRPVGTVRWDLQGEGEWEVSLTVAPERRGQSLARRSLRQAEEALLEASRCSGAAVTAYLAAVHIDNAASLRLFETSAYLPDLPADSRGFMRFRKSARVP